MTAGVGEGEGDPGRSRIPPWLKGKPARIILVSLVLLAGFVLYKQFFPQFDLQQLLDDAANFLGAWTYLVVGLFAFLETGAFIGLVVPGETTLLIGGAVAGLGVINVYLLIAIAWFSAFLGDSVSFLLGRRLGRDFLVRHGSRVGITPEALEKVEGHFERHGGKTILIGRFVGLVRAIAPFIAGSSGMRYAAFAPYSILGSGLQVTIHVLVGYVFAQSIDAAAEYVGLVAGIVATFIVVAVLGYQAVKFLREPSNRARAIAWMDDHAATRPLTSLGRRFRPQLRFLADRFTPGEAFGLEFTSLLAVMAVSSFVVIAFTEIFLGNGGPTPGDETATSVVEFLRTGWLTSVSEVLTVLGSRVVVFPLATVAALVLLWRRRYAETAVLVASMVTIGFGVDLMKEVVGRPRPEGGLVAVSGQAFPSGHAAWSVFYTWLAITIALRIPPDLTRRTVVVTAGLAVTGLVGLTRVYLGVHYLSDVTGGWAFAAFWFAFFATIALVTTELRKT